MCARPLTPWGQTVWFPGFLFLSLLVARRLAGVIAPVGGRLALCLHVRLA